MSVNYIANVPKLKGRENYDDWCFAVQNVLVLENMADKIKTQLSASASASDIESDAKAKAKLILTYILHLYMFISSRQLRHMIYGLRLNICMMIPAT
ncbi:unnamed protein product [Pieris macdunnoughi]|uniref:Uncharacterized protein n=1 Tax=Pieris macdunnoughi TaxID=345717 RepID=A0A821W2B5_9NEOP|nr:unnamed protein product [Pieris macdunnoughi]